MNRSPGVLFRVDTGIHVGLGHLQRCVSLATALRRLGATCRFVTNQELLGRDHISQFGFESETVSGGPSWDDRDLEQTCAKVVSHDDRVVVVDSDHAGAGYLQGLRDRELFVCAIDDLASHPFPCQFVINGDAHARELSYQSSSGDTQFLLGPAYTMLRQEFWEIPTRTIRDVPQNILVTVGGADPYNLMPGLLGLVGRLPGPLSITAILGPFFKNHVDVKVAASSITHTVRLIDSPTSVREIMLEADIAISAGGQTLYELARVGCPTVAVRMAANQDGQMQACAKAGFVKVAGCADDRTILTTIGEMTRLLLPDLQARITMSLAGQRLVDGRGAQRVAHGILKEAAHLPVDPRAHGSTCPDVTNETMHHG